MKDKIDKIAITYNAILRFVDAFESVDKDQSGIDKDQSSTKRMLVQQIKELAVLNTHHISDATKYSKD